MELREFQRRFLHRLYQYDPATGRRRYRRALWGVAKGNGKTPVASWIAAYELCSGSHASPRVIVGAASLKQANLVFGDLKVTLKESKTLNHLVDPYDLQVLLKDRPGVAERIAGEAGTNDGARATAFIADELHEWMGRVERVYMIVDGAIAKRKDAFTLAISTAGYDRESLLYGLYEHGLKVSKGEIVDDSFLFEWYEGIEDADLEDPEQREEALRAANPAYGDFNDPASLEHRFQTMPRWEFERYHVNRWTAGITRWIPMENWDACGSKTDIEEGDYCYVGVDGAAKRDTTAIVAVFPKGEKLHVMCDVFRPTVEGEVIDPLVVENHIRDLCQRYEVRSAPFDPALFFRSAQLLLEEGYPMEEFPQTHARMIPASQVLYDAVMEGKLVHGGDRTLRSHADAAVARETGRGWRLDKDRASVHIDAVVALAMAVHEATEDMNHGEPLASWA